MPPDPQPPQSGPPSYLTICLVALGSAVGGCLLAVALVFVYYLALPDSAGGGDAGFALLGDALRNLMVFGVIGTVAGAAIGLFLLTLSRGEP